MKLSGSDFPRLASERRTRTWGTTRDARHERFTVQLAYDVVIYILRDRRDDMLRKELIFVMSRTFALLLISWALAELTYLPERLFALTHRMSQGSALARYDYWSSYYVVITSFLVVRVLALFLAARSFWTCGPWVQELFSAKEDNREAST